MYPANGWPRFAAGAVAGLIVRFLLARTSSVKAAGNQRNPTEIEIGGEMVKLGSPKAQLIERLSQKVVVKNSGEIVAGAELWMVTTGDTGLWIGDLEFKNHVLIRASRLWDDFEPDARTTGFVRAFYDAVDHVFGNGKSGSVDCRLTREPGKEHFQVNLKITRRCREFFSLRRYQTLL